MSVQLTPEMISGAIEAEKEYKVPASVTLAQIVLESGGSKPGGLSELAYKYNNLFGIKKGTWNGATATYGKNTYRAYNSVQDSITDHAKVLNQNIYTSKTNGVTDINGYIEAIAPVYEPYNSNYAAQLKQIIKECGLDKYDGNFQLPAADGSTTTEKSDGKFKILGLDFSGIISKGALMLIIIILVLLAGVFFVNAFNIPVTKNDVIKKVVTKKGGGKK